MRCGKPVLSERREYCDDCARALEHHRQMREDDSYRQGKALFAYKGSIKQTMYRFKYSNRREYCGLFCTDSSGKIFGLDTKLWDRCYYSGADAP